MSEHPIFDAINKPIEVPPEEPTGLAIGVEITPKDQGASVQATTDFGGPGGWSGGVKGSLWQSAGAAIKGWLSWTGKPRR